MSTSTYSRRLSSILKPYSAGEGRRLSGSPSQNKVRFDHLAIESVLQEVLQSKNLQRYENLLAIIKEEHFDDGKFQQVFIESKRSVYLLNTNFQMLVEALLSVDWLARNEDSQEVFKDFVIELLVAHANYIPLTVAKLVQLLIPCEEDRDGWINGMPSDEKLNTFAPVHNLFQRLKNMIPMIFDVILNQLRKHFPYFKKSPHIVCGFLHNVLWMTEYTSMFLEELLELIFNRLLIIDVNAPRNAIEDAEFPENDEEMFTMEEDNVPAESDDNVMKLPVAETLDCCMEKMFEYFSRRAMSDKSGETDRLFKLLMLLFDNHILPTHKTHHVQFLMFYMCSLKQSYAEYFITYLWKQVCNPNIPATIRQAAVGYIASLLARAKFLNISLLKSTLQEFSQWTHGYIQRSDSMQYTQSLKAHLVFYAVCQAIFYVVAFRSKQLTSNPKNLAFMQTLQLSSIVTCHLNPLRVCLPAVATAFAGVTRAHQLAYCHTILERNARRKLAIVYKNGAQTPEECLDTFFPFDPYLLKKSGKRIEPIYLQYNAEEDHGISSTTRGSGRKRYESMSEDVDDFIQEHKRHKSSHGADTTESMFTYSYGVSPGFHN